MCLVSRHRLLLVFLLRKDARAVDFCCYVFKSEGEEKSEVE
jgi:hypothetical protein